MSDRGSKKFGVVLFDNDKDPSAGWAYVNGDERAKRIASADDLSTGTIWWTNINSENFFRDTGFYKRSWLRHDKYLIVNQRDVMREWNLDPETTDPAFVCKFTSIFFTRIMTIAFKLIRGVYPRIVMEDAFVAQTLRDDIRVVLPSVEYPIGDAATIMKADKAFAEFTVTTMRPPRDSTWITLRKPRLPYALSMFETPTPIGPFESVSRQKLKNVDKNNVIRTDPRPWMVEIDLENVDPDIAPVYSFSAVVDKNKRIPRTWVPHNEFHVLDKISDVNIKSGWVGQAYGTMGSGLPDNVNEFLRDRFNASSWSAGIIAETLWRACCLKACRSKAGKLDGEDRAGTSWQGAWLKGADKLAMFSSAMDLVKLGYSISSYGIGWIRASVQEEARVDFLRDALSTGLIPVMADVPDGIFSIEDNIDWGGGAKSRAMATLQVTKHVAMLSKLDRFPLLGKDDKDEHYKKLLKKKT